MGILKKSVELIKGQAKLIFGVTVGVLIGGGASAIVLAAIPDASGVIHACYKTGLVNNGQVRVIDSPSASCNANEAAINLNSATPGQFVTNLVGADFTDANLAYHNFAGQDMHGSNLTQTNLKGSNFSSANMSGATYAPVNLTNTNFENANFTNANIDSIAAQALGTTSFKKANFTNATIGGNVGCLQQGDFSEAKFTSTIIYYLCLDGVNFSNIDFKSVISGGTIIINNANLNNSKFTTTTNFNPPYLAIQNGSAVNTDFSGTHFVNASLSGTNLSQSILTNVTWSNTECPDNTNSDNNGNTCIGHLVP